VPLHCSTEADWVTGSGMVLPRKLLVPGTADGTAGAVGLMVSLKPSMVMS
jgi:hypothetical protein